MDRGRRERVEALFEAALDRPAAERAGWLREACWDDPELHDRVERLLAAHERAEGVLEHPPRGVELLGLRVYPETLRRVGPYRLVREIGRGGMGSVYLAERDDDQFSQQVAVKLVPPGAASAEVLRRFRAERQILASLHHPGIARLLDGGVADDARPYFVMEYVDGEPIDAYCDARSLPLEARLRLFCDAARAVHHAHRNLVVHRDLKPSNVLVSREGEVRLLDFGIAKLLDPAAAPHTVPVTRTGDRLMTPQYAAPEQVRGGPVTTATDVYGLGLLLYELLCGRRPYELWGRPPAEVERLVCEAEPPRPGAAALLPAATPDGPTPADSARARGTTPERLRRRLSGDLDRIVMTALRKEPDRRYPSAEQLAADVESYLEGRPIAARGDSPGYRVRRFAGRHRWGVAAAAAFVAVLSVYAATMTVQARRVQRALEQARLEAEKAEQVTAFTLGLFEAGDPTRTRGDSLTVHEMLRRGVERAERLRGQPAAQAQMLDVVGRVYREMGAYDRARPVLERALALRRGVLGERHPATAESMHHLGDLLYALGRYDDAEPLYRRALALQRRLLGEPHADVAHSLASLGLLLQDRGDYPAAERLSREALAMRRELFGPEHADVAESLNALALQLQLQGRDAEAEPLLREALAMRRRLFGLEHPAVAEAMSDLGLLLVKQGRLDEAEPLYRGALAARRRMLGDEHPDVSRSQGLLAALLRRRGDLAAAESLYTAAIELGRRSMGPEHPDLAHTMNGLALLRRARGDLAGADSLTRVVLGIRRRTLGGEHPSIAVSLGQLGGLLHEQGDFAGAEPLLLEALRMRRSLLGDGHPQVAESARQLVAFYEAAGRPADAAPYRALAR
ncbi:MAG TPA: serine/threonine-protein kinase [Longimicrobiaceae bacterium]|nr:serine/threonine-protein kinase [Longimicrobiaceae bacterium]